MTRRIETLWISSDKPADGAMADRSDGSRKVYLNPTRSTLKRIIRLTQRIERGLERGLKIDYIFLSPLGWQAKVSRNN